MHSQSDLSLNCLTHLIFILPVVAYGYQTWLHETNVVKVVTKDNDGKAILQKNGN